jgi:hypothetical protein
LRRHSRELFPLIQSIAWNNGGNGSILGKNGKIIAILGIDINAKGEFNLLRKLRIIIVFVIILSIFLSFLAGAADWGERLYLRNPKNTSNLINLINVLLIQNNLSRANRFLERLDELEHDKEKSNKLKLIYIKKSEKTK